VVNSVIATTLLQHLPQPAVIPTELLIAASPETHMAVRDVGVLDI
jgi:hypothetical protein